VVTDVLDEVVNYLESSIQLMTKSPATDVSYTENIRSNESLKQEVITYTFLIKINSEQMEFLTREEGSALSAMSHIVSVIFQNHGIAATLGFERED